MARKTIVQSAPAVTVHDKRCDGKLGRLLRFPSSAAIPETTCNGCKRRVREGGSWGYLTVGANRWHVECWLDACRVSKASRG
jgi:hypothetical protein